MSTVLYRQGLHCSYSSKTYKSTNDEKDYCVFATPFLMSRSKMYFKVFQNNYHLSSSPSIQEPAIKGNA